MPAFGAGRSPHAGVPNPVGLHACGCEPGRTTGTGSDGEVGAAGRTGLWCVVSDGRGGFRPARCGWLGRRFRGAVGPSRAVARGFRGAHDRIGGTGTEGARAFGPLRPPGVPPFGASPASPPSGRSVRPGLRAFRPARLPRPPSAPPCPASGPSALRGLSALPGLSGLPGLPGVPPCPASPASGRSALPACPASGLPQDHPKGCHRPVAPLCARVRCRPPPTGPASPP